MCENLLVAFGTIDGKTFTKEHFGDSEIFVIYKIYRDGRTENIEERPNTARHLEEREHGDPRKFMAIIDLLRDVDVLVAWAMGPNYLRIRDISDKVPYILKGEARKTLQIKDALREIVEKYDDICEMIVKKKQGSQEK